MKKRHILYCAGAAVLCATGLGAAPAAAVPMVHVVRPGDSVQRAVDAARPGDTVLLTEGTYRESVRVTTSGLILRGMGPRTVLTPAAGEAADACARAGNGICVEGADGRPVGHTTIASLTLSGFAKTGLWSSRTDRLTVRNVTAEKNGQWGIAQERSTRGIFKGNTARGNGDAGLFLANTVATEAGATDTGGTVVEHNHLRDNRNGITLRRLRNLSVGHNDITANCVGVVVVGDENSPHGGHLAVHDNRVVANNKFCPKTARLPFLQGSGIVLTGVEETEVTGNEVTDNKGSSPMSGGIVLFKSFVGAHNERNKITDNTLRGNAPADLVDSNVGRGNVFKSNSCGASKPTGLC
ncbi:MULTISPECIES: right-handed parallel beta-helix repeat-containing protein [unclassified Streptomyces]|uniref:right-handed parallel beta-helix repeat-containing protein n=1 Tax=unclassified Streptomyces TaxID=2593676 RepID=UPI002E36F905|nr:MULTISPECIES: right-handed parallel beta-helix repeat-containing protein [unclassified Streptomyces]WUC68044.1 right-handed parallel beta-helix repeat-containing protein [Streptomyces sp. NBC_00539]